MNQLNKLCRVLTGSHLYRLDTPKSDRDYDGVFLPTHFDCILQQVPKIIKCGTGRDDRKNTSKDRDEKYFSLHSFIKLLGKGELVCFDLLHADDDFVLETSNEWEYLRANRKQFYSKRMKGFLGFVMGQTRKYSDRGNRYNTVKQIIHFLEQYDEDVKLKEIWYDLPKNEYAYVSVDSANNDVYCVCERMVHSTVTVKYAINVFSGYKTLYGSRAKMAAENEGYDLKAISHAFRCLDELEQIIYERDITFPTKNRDRILKIKLGQEQLTDGTFVEMDERVEKLKVALDNSDLPDSIDVDYWNEWIYDIYVKAL